MFTINSFTENSVVVSIWSWCFYLFIFCGGVLGCVRLWLPFWPIMNFFLMGWESWVVWFKTIIQIQREKNLKFPFRFAIQPGPSCIFVQQKLRLMLNQKLCSMQESQKGSVPVLKEAEVN